MKWLAIVADFLTINWLGYNITSSSALQQSKHIFYVTIVNKNKRENIQERWVILTITLTLVENWPLRILRKKKLSVKDFFSKYVKLHKKNCGFVHIY